MIDGFDPEQSRKQFRDWTFKFLEKSDLLCVAPSARNHFSHLHVGQLTEAVLIGKSGSVRGILDRQLVGMRSVPEPERGQYHHSTRGEAIWCERLAQWRQLLGVCQWLAGEPAEEALAASLEAERRSLLLVPEPEALEDRGERCQGMSEYLAVALAANTPRLGMERLGYCKLTQFYIPIAPLLGFGAWACHHLATGGGRDEAFLVRGKQALRSTLLSVMLPNAQLIEIALWLKAIFFDSGAAKSAEEAMMLAYECMPGIRRPDFE